MKLSCELISLCIGHYCPEHSHESIACITAHDESSPAFECLSVTQICDGTKDCLDGEDETSCGQLKYEDFKNKLFFFY